MTNLDLARALQQGEALSHDQWVQLFATCTDDERLAIMALARQTTQARFGRIIYFRGIVEFSNRCRNDCYYCGLRRSNRAISRYRLTNEQILACCREGYAGGFRTFVLQSGEDASFTDAVLCELVEEIHRQFPDCAITLSVGERSRQSYEALFHAGATRYLLRHETITPAHYAMLHPANMQLANRIRCLQDLKDIGYQVGCGIMVGIPGQTPDTLANDMEFTAAFRPHMVGIGPFLPHSQTPFAGETAGSVAQSLLCLALTRLMLPDVLLPSTTALGTAEADGRKQGVLAGCNVVMPNLSPFAVRKSYMLYDNKSGTDMTAAASMALLKQQMEEIGYQVVVGKGDHPQWKGAKQI